MYCEDNARIERQFKNQNIVPSDVDYGGYIMREIEALGFSVERKPSNSGFIFIITLFNGKTKAAFLCKANPGNLFIPNDAFVSLCIIKGASLYGVITNIMLLGEKAALLRSKGYVPYGGYNIGDNIMDVLTSCGLIPSAIGEYLKRKTADDDVAFDQSFNYLIAEPEEEIIQKAQIFVKAERTMVEKYEAGECDDLINDALRDFCKNHRNKISAGNLARILGIKMSRANKILYELEMLGVVGSSVDGQAREVLLTPGMIEKRFDLYDDDIDWVADEMKMYGLM